MLQEANSKLRQAKVKTLINKKEIDCIVNIGSDRSIISGELAKILGLKTNEIQPNTIESISKQSITSNAISTFFVKFLKGLLIEYEITALIITINQTSLILGLNFLQKDSAVVDFKNYLLSFGSNIILLNEVKSYKEVSKQDQQLIKKIDCFDPVTKTNGLPEHYGFLNKRLGLFETKPHKIVLPDKTPCKHKPFQIPEKLKKVTEAEIDRLQRKGIIRPSSSEYSNRGFPIWKRSGEIRLVADYRVLNSQTQKLAFQILTMCEQF